MSSPAQSIEQAQRDEGTRRESFGGGWTTYTDEDGTTTEIRSFGEGLEALRAADEAIRTHPYRDLIDRINSPTFEDEAQAIYGECFELLVQRQVRYGPLNIERQGMWGVLSRIANDKIERIKRSFSGRVENGEIVLDDIVDTDQDESFEDAVKDVINYGVILLLLKRGTWGRPLAGEIN